jgi:uncharacterized membrane protein
VRPVWGLRLLALVGALIIMEIVSTKAMKRLGIEPSPAAKWLRIANIAAVLLVVGLAIWIVLK